MESVEQVLSGVRRRPVAVAAPGQAAPAEAGGLDVAHGDPDADPSDLPPVRSVSLDEAVTAEPDGLFEPRPGGAEPEGWGASWGPWVRRGRVGGGAGADD